MPLKRVVTIVLVLFVIASVVYLAARELPRRGQAPAPLPPTGVTPAVASTNTADDAAAPAHQVLAYYLHNSTRCPSCLKIEKYTTNAINGGFADELDSGALVFKVLNTDEKPNAHFVKDYQLVTKSVILADLHDGKQTRWVNLEKVWDLLGDEKEFAKYIQSNVRDYLDVKK